MKNFYIWYLKWICHWAKFIDGLLGIITFNLINTSLSLRMAKKLAKKRNQ